MGGEGFSHAEGGGGGGCTTSGGVVLTKEGVLTQALEVLAILRGVQKVSSL